MEKLIIEVVVGYMYKVQKNGLNVSNFHNEFSAIRHGDYFKFVNLIGKRIDFILTSDHGKIDTNNNISEDEIAVIALIKSAESLRDFYSRCLEQYGVFKDKDLSDEDFERAALFEISLRIHSNNKRLKRGEITFENVINGLHLDETTKSILHGGRKFINDIKRPYKRKIPWNEGLKNFNLAYEMMISNQLTIR